MRLICGLMRLDGGNADEALLRRMAAQMDVPRLKPGLAVWREGQVALAVLDFAAGDVTLAQAGAHVIAADVRLDEPQTPDPQDAQLLVALQAGRLAEVMGDFAFARWDRETQTMTCGRDIFGIRPFCYSHQPGQLFAFASFGQALHGSGVVEKRIDQEALARRVARALRADDSLIAGIQRLPAAHVLEVSRKGIALKRYWQLDRASVGKREMSPDAAAQEMRRLVDQAVACRLPTGAQIGAHLSGGLDSSAITVLAARHLRDDGRTLHAYSFLDRQRNDITLVDETDFVQAVLAQEKDIDWTPVRPHPGGLLPGHALDADKMFALNSDAPENQVCTRAEDQGVGLILSGWGGDEAATFNGRGVFAELLLRGHWRTLVREFSALRRERRWSLPKTLYGEIVSYLTPDPIIDLAKRLAGRSPGGRKLFSRILSAKARARMAADKGDELSMAPDGRENRWRLITSPHIAERTEVWAQTGARHGVAFAFPLLDRRVVEFALSLPSALFLRGGFRRRPFRDAMADVLPDRVRQRHEKYMPFPGHLLDLAESKDEFLARIEDCEKSGNDEGLIDFAHLRSQLAQFPSADQARKDLRNNQNPEATAQMIAVAQALTASTYIDMHRPDDRPTRDDDPSAGLVP